MPFREKVKADKERDNDLKEKRRKKEKEKILFFISIFLTSVFVFRAKKQEEEKERVMREKEIEEDVRYANEIFLNEKSKIEKKREKSIMHFMNKSKYLKLKEKEKESGVDIEEDFHRYGHKGHRSGFVIDLSLCKYLFFNFTL
jgi:hypothetical protein